LHDGHLVNVILNFLLFEFFLTLALFMKKRQYYRAGQKSKKPSLKRKIFGGLFFSFLAALIYFFFFSDIFRVERIEIKGVEKIPASEIEKIVQENLKEKLWQIIPQKSLILLSTAEIQKDILDSFAEIDSVDFSKKLPGLLIVGIKERKSVGIWCRLKDARADKQSGSEEDSAIVTSSPLIIDDSDGFKKREIHNCFYIDRKGIIYQEAPLITGSLVLNIYGRKSDTVSIRDQVVSPDMIEFILSAKEGLKQIESVVGSSMAATDFEIVSWQDVGAKTSSGWQIYFNPTYSVESQLRALEIVLEEEIKKQVDSLEYIDLRIKGRVYYR
jgi:hypothetical protein